MSIRIGTTEPKAIKVGNRDVLSVYAGAEKVWPIVNDATVLKLKYILQNASGSQVPYEVTDKTESPQWRFWMRDDVDEINLGYWTDMIVEEIPADAEIKFVLVGQGGSGMGALSGYGAGGGGEIIEYTLPAGSLKSGDKFRINKRDKGDIRLNYCLDFITASGDVFFDVDVRNGGDGNKNVGGYGWVDGEKVSATNDGGSGAGGPSPNSDGDGGVFLEEWGERFGEGGFGGMGRIKEYTIGMGAEGTRGGSVASKGGQQGGIAFQSNVPIEVTL